MEETVYSLGVWGGWITLAACLLFSVWTDIKTHKIYNKPLLVFFLIGLFFACLRTVFHSAISFSMLTDVIFIVLLSFFLWKNNIWAGGDAKLFIVLAILIPFDFYRIEYFQFFRSFSLLFNIFIFAFCFVFIKYFVNIFLQNKNVFKIFSEIILIFVKTKEKLLFDILVIFEIALFAAILHISTIYIFFIFIFAFPYMADILKKLRTRRNFLIVLFIFFALVAYKFFISGLSEMLFMLIIFFLFRILILFIITLQGVLQVKLVEKTEILFSPFILVGFLFTILTQGKLLFNLAVLFKKIEIFYSNFPNF